MQRAMMGSSVVRASHARLDIGARDGCTVMGVVTLTRTCEAYMQCECQCAVLNVVARRCALASLRCLPFGSLESCE
jgi:hypothetical protein